MVQRPSIILKFIVLGLLVTPAGCDKPGGCGKDSDCKGDRTCVQGECVSPGQGLQKPGGIQPTKSGTIAPPAAFKHAIVRASPALDAPEVGQILAGTKVDLVDTTADGRWYRIRCPQVLGDQTAWVHRDVVRAN